MDDSLLLRLSDDRMLALFSVLRGLLEHAEKPNLASTQKVKLGESLKTKKVEFPVYSCRCVTDVCRRHRW